MKKFLIVTFFLLILSTYSHADEKIKLICGSEEDVELTFDLDIRKIIKSGGEDDFYYDDNNFYWIQAFKSLNNELANRARTRLSRLTGILTIDMYKLVGEQEDKLEWGMIGSLQETNLKKIKENKKIDTTIDEYNSYIYHYYKSYDQFKIVYTSTMNCKKSKNLF